MQPRDVLRKSSCGCKRVRRAGCRTGWNLGAADDGSERALGVADGTVKVVELLLEEETGDGRLEELGDAGRGGVGAVGSAEGVVDVPARGYA